MASPDADNLARIAQAFGDGPDTVAQLRADAEAQAAEDVRIAAEVSDKELVERIASTLRQTFDGLLDDANAQYAQRLASVQEQYRDYLDDAEQRYAERLEAEQRHHAQLEEQNQLAGNISSALRAIGQSSSPCLPSFWRRSWRTASTHLPHLISTPRTVVCTGL